MKNNRHLVPESIVRSFRAGLHGVVLAPDDEEYDEARSVWNAMVDRHPALIARCATTADVVRTVEFARTHDLRLAVRAGGHNVAGHAVCDDGLVVDLSTMSDVRVAPERQTARVESGATTGEFDRTTEPYGLATPMGIISTTGVAGLTLGGGWGWLSRSHGLAIDNLRSVEVVTADGSVVRASEAENADLFWGLRGGGGNFGVVTEFEFQLHEVPRTVYSGVLVYPFAVAADLLRVHRALTATAPPELCCYTSIRTAPSTPLVPESLQGEKIATAYLCHLGSPDEAQKAIRPLREFHPPLVDTVEPRPYTAFQQFFDDFYPPGFRNYWKSQFVDDAGLSEDAIDTLVSYASTVPSPYTSIVVEHLGGEINRVDAAATAYPHRDAAYAFNLFSRWTDAADDERNLRWTHECYEAMLPHLTDGVYVNFLGREGEARVRAAFGDHYDRLAEVKRAWDPENVFRGNQNVDPRRTT